MAKAYKQKARKEYTCSKCGRTINKGEEYYKIEAMYSKTKYRCLDCKPERSELTESEYYKWLWDLQDHLEERYDLSTEEGKNELYNELENVRDELQDKLDNMPEQLQYAPTGEMLQERIDAIDDAMNELDNADYPDREDCEDEDDYNSQIEDYKETVSSAVYNIE